MQADGLISFEAGGASFAIQASAVSRVLPVPRLTLPPCAPAALAGFFCYGGELVCVLKFCALLDLPCPAKPGLYDHIILLRDQAPRIALLVDHAVELFEPGDGAVVPLATGLSHRDSVAAEITRGDETIQLIDPRRLVSDFERECAERFIAVEERRRGAFAEACE